MNSKAISQIHFITLATILMAFALTFFTQDLNAKKQKGKYGPYSFIEFPSKYVHVNKTTIKEITILQTADWKKYYLAGYKYNIDNLHKYVVKTKKGKEKLMVEEAFYINGVDPLELINDRTQFREHVHKSFFLPGKDSLRVDAFFRQHPTVWYLLEGDGTVTAYHIDADDSIFNLYTPEEVLKIFENINKYKFYTLPTDKTIGRCSESECYLWYDLKIPHSDY